VLAPGNGVHRQGRSRESASPRPAATTYQMLVRWVDGETANATHSMTLSTTAEPVACTAALHTASAGCIPQPVSIRSRKAAAGAAPLARTRLLTGRLP
jgi:hypothetical protein